MQPGSLIHLIDLLLVLLLLLLELIQGDLARGDRTLEFGLFLGPALGNLLALLVLPGAKDVDQVRQLTNQDKGHGHDDDHGAAAARVDHERRQPALELVGERGDHEDERSQER